MKAFWYDEKRKNVCGEQIRKLRKEKGMSTKDLEIKASLSGFETLTQNAIIKIELGYRFVPDYEVGFFAALLDTTPEYLIGFPEKYVN